MFYVFYFTETVLLGKKIVKFRICTFGVIIFDIWWSSLDIINDFKAIFRMEFFRFGEINKSLFWVFSKKIFNFLGLFITFLNTFRNLQEKLENVFFTFRNLITNQKTQNNDLFISPKWKNDILEMTLKNWVPDCSAQRGFWQKLFRLKACPQGVLTSSPVGKIQIFFISTTYHFFNLTHFRS